MTVRRIRNVTGMVMASGLMLGSAGAWAQGGSTLPDAQVESNVLRALASAPELSTQNIQTATVYGTVTLTGNIHDEALRTQAENLAARAQGVKKVVDELTLGDTPAVATADPAAQAIADPAAQNGGNPGRSVRCVAIRPARTPIRWNVRSSPRWNWFRASSGRYPGRPKRCGCTSAPTGQLLSAAGRTAAGTSASGPAATVSELWSTAR